MYRQIFGVGPVGVCATIIVWMVFYFAGEGLSIPKMAIHPVLRGGMLFIFLIDAVYLLGGGITALVRNGWGIKLVTTGPYQFIRHPIYSVLIYSATGALALWLYSWLLLASVIPLSLFWSWLVQKEERYMLERFGAAYRAYMERTGQFFPSMKALKEE